jgi:hypothetical protein
VKNAQKGNILFGRFLEERALRDVRSIDSWSPVRLAQFVGVLCIEVAFMSAVMMLESMQFIHVSNVGCKTQMLTRTIKDDIIQGLQN